MISVIVPQNRIGGLDLLFTSLAAQTYRDFELILVDNIKAWRSKWCFSAFAPAEDCDIPSFSHIAPIPNDFPAARYCRTVNSGIAHAHGDTIVMLCDYSFLAPGCLATHAACQAANPGPTHLDYNYSALPELKPGLPFYGQKHPPESPHYLEELRVTTEHYVNALDSGQLDPFMWSIFAETPTEESVLALPVEHKHRPCTLREPGDWNFCSFKNESFPTELLLEMNGLDEKLDQSHTYQDLEFSYRLRERGIPWHNGPPETGMVTVVNPRKVLNVKTMEKPIAANKAYTDGKDYRAMVNPSWSLRSWRKETLGL